MNIGKIIKSYKEEKKNSFVNGVNGLIIMDYQNEEKEKKNE